MPGVFSSHYFDPKKTHWTIDETDQKLWFWQRTFHQEGLVMAESQGGFKSLQEAIQEATKQGYQPE